MNSIGWAVKELQKGNKVRRVGWDVNDMFLFLVPENTFKANRAPILGIFSEDTAVTYCSSVNMKTADNKIISWTCSQIDLLAIDWESVK